MLIRKSALLLLFCTCWLLAVMSHDSEGSQKKTVLILNSYHRGYKGSDQFTDGFLETLLKTLPQTETQIEYLDSINYSGKEYDDRILDLLRFKYQRKHYDLIFSTDDYAFNVLDKYRDSMFGSTPVVFCGTNSFDSSRLKGKQGFYGIDERPSFSDTLALIFQLHPDTREIVVVHDTAVTGQKNKAEFCKQALPFSKRTRFTFLAGLRQEELTRRISLLQPGSVVMFFSNYVENGNGERISPHDACQQLAAASKVPIYSGWEFMLGKGIVGGKLLYLREHGTVAAKMAVNILKGSTPATPVTFSPSPNRYMFDYNQMERFGIDESQLPKGSIFINKPPGFFATYKVALLLALCAALVLALIGIFSKLLCSRKDLAASLVELREAQSELLSTARKAGMAEIATNVLHNVGNVLNSVNVSAGVLRELVRNSKVRGLTLTVQLLNQHSHDIARYLADDAKGKLLPEYLDKLAEALGNEQHRMLEELSQLTKSVDHIKDIVAMQQSYAGAASVIEPVAVADLLEDAIRMNAGSLHRHHVTVVKDIPEMPLLVLDKARVLQILVNLISNGKSAMSATNPERHYLTLKAELINRNLRLSVADQGEGIAPENLSRIFTHGFTTRRRGHGFGLHSCALAAKEMGGTLTASSAGVGRGATFTLELPVTAEEKAA